MELWDDGSNTQGDVEQMLQVQCTDTSSSSQIYVLVHMMSFESTRRPKNAIALWTWELRKNSVLGELMPHAIVTPCELLAAVWCIASVYACRCPSRTPLESVAVFDMIIPAVRTFERLCTIRCCTMEKRSFSGGLRILLWGGRFRRALDRRTGCWKLKILCDRLSVLLEWRHWMVRWLRRTWKFS